MATMAENSVCEVVSEVPAGDVKCRKEVGVVDGAAPSGETEKQQAHHGYQDVSEKARDHLVQGKKKRRRKTKRKAPYNKMSVDNRNRSKKAMRGLSQKRPTRYKQPEAPYNSNRFLIEDHNDLKDFDVDLMAAANKGSGEGNDKTIQKTPQRGRVRDCSFTSVESDEDFFYSSPEDEEEFLTKEFSNTYKDLHVEALANLSKGELIQHILFLEEKMDSTQKKLEALTQTNYEPNGVNMSERLAYFQEEISKLVSANKTLLHENEELRRQRRTTASSEDSESDSSSSTCSSSSSSCSDMSDNDTEQRTPDGSPKPEMNGEAHPESTTSNLMDTENAT